MAISSVFDLVAFSTPTTGTGTVTVGAALNGRRTPAQAGVPDGTNVSYTIIDGANFEFGQGVTGGSGTTLTRPGPLGSSSGGSRISLSGNANISFTMLGEDVFSANPYLYFDTLAQFQALTSIPAGVTRVVVRAVTGTYPPASGLEATPLTYRRVGSSTGLYGEVTVGGVIFAPVYSTNPVNMGEFGVIGDAVTSMLRGAAQLTATSTGTATVTTSDTTNLVVGMLVANFNWATLGAGAVPAGTTVLSFVPNTSVTFSNTCPAGTNLKFVCWVDTVTGTDNIVPMQAAIDFAIQNGCVDVKVPLGKFKTSDTLQVGWGDTFHEIHLIGQKRANSLGFYNGAAIFPTATDRPCINFSAMRTASISGVSLVGRNFLYVMYGLVDVGGFVSNLSPNKNDWLAPNLTPTGSNSGGITQNAPYAGITIDGYHGTQPTVHYPNRTFPSWTGKSTQYNDPSSSDVTIDDCDIEGFAVPVCVMPNGDDNGDFTRIRNTTIGCGVFGIAVCQTQSRNVEIRNINFQGFHSFLTNLDLGMGQGFLCSPVDNCAGGECYQLFNISLNQSGPLVVNSLYSENSVRIGNLLGTGGFAHTAVFNGGSFGCNDALNGTIPGSYMTCGTYGLVLLNGFSVFGNSRISNWVSSGTVLFNGGVWEAATASGTTAALRQAVNYSGGILAGSARFSSTTATYKNLDNFRVSQVAATYYDTVGGAIASLTHDDRIQFSSSVGTLARAPMTQCGRTYMDSQGRSWRITVPPEMLISMTFTSMVPTPPSYSSDVMTFTYAASYFVAQGVISVGDILYQVSTGTIFVVTAVAGPTSGNYTITSQQQNNLKIDSSNGFVANLNPDAPMTTNNGYVVLIKTGAVIPRQLEYATFTAASINLTGIQRGDTTATDLATYYAVGDPLMPMEFYYQSTLWPIGSYTTIASLTPGNPGSATLSVAAAVSGTFPLFPYEIR